MRYLGHWKATDANRKADSMESTLLPSSSAAKILPGIMPPDWILATLQMDEDNEGVAVHSSPVGWRIRLKDGLSCKGKRATRHRVGAPLGRRRRRCGGGHRPRTSSERIRKYHARFPTAAVTWRRLYPQLVHPSSTAYSQANPLICPRWRPALPLCGYLQCDETVTGSLGLEKRDSKQ